MNTSERAKSVREALVIIGVTVLVYLVIYFTLQHSVVEGSSMQPSLENGQRLLVNKTAFMFDQPQRGEIVIIHPPGDPQKQWVKRVIGLPGDVVSISGGQVYVDGVPLEEPYIQEKPAYSMPATVVPEDCYFVLGDNRNHSSDSHLGWTVPRNSIVGEVWLRFWPLNNWGVVPAYPLNDEIALANQ
jgi:signal peptidase I